MSLIFFEPTDRRKACKALCSLQQGQLLGYSSPNLSELRAMANFIKPKSIMDTTTQISEIIELAKIVSQYINTLIVTIGSEGVVTVHRVDENGKACLYVQLYPTTVLPHVENVSGAGDCFSSGFIHGILLGMNESHCVSIGFQAAKHALLCKQTVPLKFNFKQSLKAANCVTSRYEID